MKSSSKKINLKAVYIKSVATIIVVLIFNLIIRSITVIQVNYIGSEKAIVEVRKYYKLFPFLTFSSIAILLAIFSISFILTLQENIYNKKRLQELKNTFENIGLQKINNQSSVLDENDMIVIAAWNKSIEEVTLINEKRDKYFKQMIHDFNAPIQILKMNAQMNILKNDKKYAIAIEDEVQELERKISNYLHIEKISYFEKPDFRQVNIITHLQAIKDKYCILGVNIEIIYSHSNIMYLTDKRMLNNIIQNLIENAIKYGKDKNINIIVKSNQLEVSNNLESGKYVGNIFEGNGRNYSENGNGLGVEIVRTYAKMLNLSIESTTQNEKFIVTIKNCNSN